MSWNKPSSSHLDRGMFIKGYEILYHYEKEWIFNETTDTTFTVSDLPPETSVDFVVKAQCSCGRIGPGVYLKHSTLASKHKYNGVREQY